MSVWNMTDFSDIMKEHCTDIEQEKSDLLNHCCHIIKARTVHDGECGMLITEGWMPLDKDECDEDDFNRRHQFYLPHEQNMLHRVHWPTCGSCGQCLLSGPMTEACKHDLCVGSDD